MSASASTPKLAVAASISMITALQKTIATLIKRLEKYEAPSHQPTLKQAFNSIFNFKNGLFGPHMFTFANI